MTSLIGKPIELLLVEDNPGDVILAKRAFRDMKLSNNISVANHGEEALDILFKRNGHEDAARPDLILLDLNMPRMDGKQVLSIIKQDENLRKIPVIVMTGSDAETDVVNSYDLHANSFVVKPANPEQFAKVVKSMEEFWFTIVKLPGRT